MSRRRSKRKDEAGGGGSSGLPALLFNSGAGVDFVFGDETIELKLDGTALLSEVKAELEAQFGEGPLALVYEYGRGKKLLIRQDDEFQAAMITWPGCPKIKFKVILEALAVGDFEALCLQRLVYLEAGHKDKLASLENDIFDKFQRAGTVMITHMGDCMELTSEYGVFHVLGLIMKMRQLTHPIIRRCGGNIVKAEGEKTFVVFDTPAHAMTAGVLLMSVLEDYNETSDESRRIEISIGVDDGSVLLIPGDLYGDCVNVASKLGEDHAEPGEFIVTRGVHSTVKGMPEFASITFEPGTTEQSGVVIPFMSVSGRFEGDLEDNLPAATTASFALEHRESPFSRLCRQRLSQDRAGDTDLIDEQIRAKYEKECVAFCSDMSGFTRTVKKRGILHFLSLIMYMRKVVAPIIESHGGTIVKTEADNYYAVFENSDEAVRACIEAQTILRDYNSGRDDDDTVCMCMGMDVGPVLWADDEGDIYGPVRDKAELLGEEEGSKYEILVTENMFQGLRGSYDNEQRTAEENQMKYYLIKGEK